MRLPLLASLLGVSLLAYGALALLHYFDVIDAVAWATENSLWLTILCTIATLVGFAFQFLFDRWRANQRKEREERGEDDFYATILGKIGFGGSKPKRKAA